MENKNKNGSNWFQIDGLSLFVWKKKTADR